VTGRQAPPLHLRRGSGSGAIFQRATHKFCGRGGFPATIPYHADISMQIDNIIALSLHLFFKEAYYGHQFYRGIKQHAGIGFSNCIDFNIFKKICSLS